MRLGVLLFFLIIIGLLASFYSPALMAKVKTYIYKDTASPYNIEWSGTSILVKYLRKNGFEVIITENDTSLHRELSKGGLLLIIAPDTMFKNNTLSLINKLIGNGTINLAVFDENTTSNNLIEKYGVEIMGKAVLDPFNPYKPYYPRDLIYSRSNETIIYRLNWGSPLNITRATYSMAIFSITYGVLDVNDNGKLDDLTFGAYVTGVIIDTGSSQILVFGDSYPLTNDAFIRNVSATRVLLDYISWLAKMKGNRIIIPNQLYQAKPLTIQTPFHVSILFLVLAHYLEKADQFIDKLFSTFQYIELATVLASFLAFLALLKYLFGLKSIIEYKVGPIKRYQFLIGSTITRSVTDKNVVGGKEKTLITKYWEILSNTYKSLKNIDLDKIIGEKNYELLVKYGFDKKDLKNITWLYRIRVKAEKKTFLPIIISWRHVLFKYVSLTENYLNKLGYTMMNKRGYRDVTSIIK